MSWWGKVIGGAFGFALGGPLGAALGAAFGHNFDRGLAGSARIGRGFSADVEKIQSAFFTATFSVMGYLAKADGRVSETEIAVARDLMGQMRLNAAQKKVAIGLFEQGKKPDFPAAEILQQFRRECHRSTHLLQMFMEILVVTALADGSLHRQEERILRESAAALGFSAAAFQDILGRVQAQSRFHTQSRDSEASLADAYSLLGISASASDEEVKKAYRRQMNQHHPDKLVAKGLPQEMMDLATEKTQDIRNAYERIRNNRKT